MSLSSHRLMSRKTNARIFGGFLSSWETMTSIRLESWWFMVVRNRFNVQPGVLATYEDTPAIPDER